jgi:hypothetical protein
MSLSQLLGLKGRSVAREQAFGRADAAAAGIARDLENALRDWNLSYTRVAVIDSGEGDQAHDELMLLAHSPRRARPGTDTPEGGDYEVQYRIVPLQSNPARQALWRRIDPSLDIAIDGGGIASAVVAGVTSLQIDACDSDAWYEAWDSDNDGLPHAVRVLVTAVSDDGKVTASARRVVAIDRVPVPIDPNADTGATGDSGATGATGGGQTPAPTSGTPAPTPTPGGGGGGGRGGGGGGRGGGGTGGGGGGGGGPAGGGGRGGGGGGTGGGGGGGQGGGGGGGRGGGGGGGGG